MRLSRILIILVILLGGFWLVTTHLQPTHSMGRISLFGGDGGGSTSPLELTEAQAAPKYDAEEENNIAVYKRVLPSVVNITSTALVFDFFYGTVPQQGQGSGFILDKSGHILTNYHVVAGANRGVEVQLSDKRKFAAHVIGTDRTHDLALLQIDAPNLQPVTLADSSQLNVGQKVYAIGNPFGLAGTMTRGIISAIRPIRNGEGAPIEDAIQTDAAINPGNSGGALVNAHGELVGINTFIISNSGSFAGAGFAIPSQIVRSTAEQLIKNGKIEHGYLGISMNDVTPDNAHFFNLQDASGAIVAQVTPDSPAGRGGMHTGDVITKLNGEAILNGSALQVAVSEMTPGTKISLGVIRDGKLQTLDLTVGQFHGNNEVASNDTEEGPKSGKLGLSVSDLTPDTRQQINVPDQVHGVVVESVRPASPADDAGIQPGDVILEVNRKPAQSASQFATEMHQNANGKDILLLVWSKGNSSYRTIHADQDDRG